MNIVDCCQLDPLWFAARAGSVTSARIADVCAKRKRGDEEMACRRDMRMTLLCERLTKRHTDNYVSPEMEWGIENEPLARTTYEIENDCSVETVGFVLHPSIQWAGASPDGIVGSDGLLECKCPKTTTHIEYLMAGVVPAEYRPQMLWQMACCERQWCDFVSFDPRLPKHLQLFQIRFKADGERIRAMEAEVQKFLEEVETALRCLPKDVKQTVLERQLEESLVLTKQDIASMGPVRW